MASAVLTQFPLSKRSPAARHSLLTLLGEFQQALNAQFDTCRHAARYRPGLALRRLRSGVELLCRLQQELLHPALSASRPGGWSGWPALAQAMHGAASLRELAALGTRSGDTQQHAVVALLEGVAQLQFASLGELLGQADVATLPWAELERETLSLLTHWQAEVARSDVEDEALQALNLA